MRKRKFHVVFSDVQRKIVFWSRNGRLIKWVSVLISCPDVGVDELCTGNFIVPLKEKDVRFSYRCLVGRTSGTVTVSKSKGMFMALAVL